jgi:hypothetical protein
MDRWTHNKHSLQLLIQDLEQLLKAQVRFPLTETLSANFVLSDSVQALIENYKTLIERINLKEEILSEVRCAPIENQTEICQQAIDRAFDIAS